MPGWENLTTLYQNFIGIIGPLNLEKWSDLFSTRLISIDDDNHVININDDSYYYNRYS